MTRIILLRSGSTDFDLEGRIKGTLDIPLNDAGNEQATQAAKKLAAENETAVNFSPSQAAEETASQATEEKSDAE